MSILGLVCKHLEDPEVTLTGERNSGESECKRKSERKLQFEIKENRGSKKK